MGSCENSNEKSMFFNIANSCYKIKSTVFLIEIESKTSVVVVHGHYIYPKVIEVPSNFQFALFPACT